MKKLAISLTLLLFTISAFSQTAHDTIVVAPGTTGLHFYHIMQEGESLAQISQKYDVSKTKILAVNNHKDIKPYQIVKIPLKKKDVVQTGTKSSNKSLQPLYHKVSRGETLFRIGKLYSNIPLEKIKSWNDLKGNTIHSNQYLIVGWFNPHGTSSETNAQKQPTQKLASSSASSVPSKPMGDPDTATSSPQPTATTKEKGTSFLNDVISSERERVKQPGTKKAVSIPLLSKNTYQDSSENSEPAEKSTSATPLLTDTPSLQKGKSPSQTTPRHPEDQKENKEIEMEKKEHPSPNQENAPETPKKTSKEKATLPKKKEQSKGTFEKMLNQITHHPKKAKASSITSISTEQPAKNTKKKQEQAGPPKDRNVAISTPQHPHISDTSSLKKAVSEDSTTLKLAQKSAFSGLFKAQTQDEDLITSKKGAAGWFKSNIQPGSKKYYALCNNLPRGTIIKVINPINNKYIFAKVLSPIPQSKENYNLVVKLSDAAKGDLGISQSRFWSKIVFPKIN